MEENRKYTYGKKDKLKLRKLIGEIFESGSSISSYPFRVFYKKTKLETDVIAQVGVSVSKRNFKHAVDRNRIKRLMREGYRLEKYNLLDNIKEEVAVMVIYTQRKELDQKLIQEKTKKMLIKLAAELNKE
ncbi:MAG: ribonuclease P protein component [Ichthyobacteriaceae bacterium]|nr:ribonuclease P protein component [Ichthyobacteriaceae bacterium]